MPRKKKARRPVPKAGDQVLVEWLDILENPTGAAKESRPARLCSLAYFVAWRGKGKERQLVTTNCFDLDTGESYGCCSYPAGCVVSVTVIERGNK